MDTSYLAQQVTTIIGQLHGLFDDIGVPSHDRDSREAEVSIAHSPDAARNRLLMPVPALLCPVRDAAQPTKARHQRET